MRTFSVYRYKDCSLDDIKNIISNFTTWHEPVIDPITSNELEFNYETVKDLSIDLKTEILPSVFISFKNEKLSKKHKNNPDTKKRIRSNDANIIIFEEGNDLIIIPIRGKNYTTGSLLRTAFNIENEGVLTDHPFDFKEDFLYWIFNRYLNLKNITEQSDDTLNIHSLTSFTGETRDTINKIDGQGSRVSKILWTLAFLFTNESLKSITPELTHTRVVDGEEVREKIKLEITLNGTYKIDEKTHIGTQFFNNNFAEKISYLLIYSYKILIPELLELYEHDIKNGIWSPHIKMQFIAGIGSEIQAQVAETLQSIEKDLSENEEE